MMKARLISNAWLLTGVLITVGCSDDSSTDRYPAVGGQGAVGGSPTGGGAAVGLGGATGIGGFQASLGGGAPLGGATAAGGTVGALGGNTGQMGGSTGALGGSTGQMGGSTGALGGSTGALGGSTGQMGGTAGSLGGAIEQTGGTAGQTGGAAGSTGGSTEPLGGYHVHGDWAGFAFTFATDDASIDPPSDPGFNDMVDQDGPYCVSGTVDGTSTYTSIAAVGFNTKQQKVEDAEVGAVVSTGDGLVVNISNPGVSTASPTLRIQIEDGTADNPDTEEDEGVGHRWCVNISQFDTDVPLPWESFNTECWAGGDGEPFNPSTPIAKAIIYLPDNGESPQTFDFCVNAIGPTNVTGRGTGEVVASCGNSVSWTSTSTNAQFQNIQTSDGHYRFQSNGWGWTGGGHNISLLPSCGFRMDTQSCTRTDDSPCSFPSIYIGQSADGQPSAGSGLPVQISAINSIPTCLGWSSGGTPASDEYNVSFDVWFNTSSGAQEAETFLMLWFRDPPSYQAAGAPAADGVIIGDQIWTVWYGPNHQQRNVVSYVAPSARVDGQAYSFNLKDFIDDAVDRQYLRPDQYLISIMAGMEIWGGAQGASIDGFRTEIQ